MKPSERYSHRLLPWIAAQAALAFISTVSSPAQPAPATAPAAGNAKSEVVELSPFTVVADTKGYFQSNTMSGTRLNSKIEDLGQSITVMTKEQMSDFAMLDINDVFDFMANTEGTNSFSAFELDRTGAVTDNVALDPNNANRVRGIGSANIAFGNIGTTGRVPVDPLWMDSLELSRGPNANIFGLGNSSGTVNQVPATANLSREFAQTSLRGDSYGGWRASFDINRTVVKNKLAFRASYANQHTAFIREPSGENARRLSLQLKARPFKNTTLSVSWYGYKNASVRPNFTTPRDFITNWFAAGKPAWDPVTRLITINGVTYGQGMVAGSTTAITTLPSYFTNSDSRALFRVGGPGEAPYWSTPTITSVTTPFSGSSSSGIRVVNTGPANSFFGSAQPLFASTPPLADRSIYDWTDINLNSGKAWDDVNTYLAQLDQIILSTPKQTLAAQLAYMREDAKRTENLPFGPASVNSTVGDIHVDPNLRNIDGTPNPFFGRPYARTTEPFLRDKPWLFETSRAQVAYRLNFARDEGLTKWLGTQQLLGYYEYKDQQKRQYAYRHTSTSLDQQWQKDAAAAGIPLANRTASGNNYPASSNYARLYEQYYLGSTPGGGIEYGPSPFPAGASIPFVWGNTGNFTTTPSTVDWTPSPDGSGGNASVQSVIKTKGAVLQSAFLNERLVTTFGLRKDQVFDHNAPFAVLTSDLRAFDFGASDRWNSGWRKAAGNTKTASVVVRPFREIGFLKKAASEGGGVGRLLGEAINGLSLTWNKSDNFIAQGPAIDLFERSLPNQTGSSKDVGFWLTMLDGRFSLRYTHYRTDQINLRNGDISTIAQRVLRADGLNASDAWNLQDRSTEWITQLNPTWTTTQVRAEVAKTMGLPQETIDTLEANIASGTLSATQDYVSRGDELEFNLNASRAWTVSASVTKTEAINKNAGSTIEDWIAQRMPIWEKVEDPRFTQASPGGANIPVGATGHLLWRYISGSNFTTYGYNSTNSAATNYRTFVEGPLAVFRQLEGRPRPQMAKYNFRVSTRYNLSALTENQILRNMTVGGAVRWTDKKAIGFLGVQSLPAMITALDANKAVYSPAVSQVDLFVAYRTRLFRDKVRANFQLNVKNLGEPGGGLQPTAVFPDGTPLAYRILDPRQFILSASFEL